MKMRTLTGSVPGLKVLSAIKLGVQLKAWVWGKGGGGTVHKQRCLSLSSTTLLFGDCQFVGLTQHISHAPVAQGLFTLFIFTTLLVR
jgi:hypothetical protein